MRLCVGAVLLAVVACQPSPGSATRTSEGVARTGRAQPARLRIFERTALPPDGADAYLSLREVRESTPLVSGRFPVRGLELELASGTYVLTTWFRARGGGADASPVLAQCEAEVVVAAHATSSLVRVQDDGTRCHFEAGEADWNVSLHRGAMMPSSWWVSLAHDDAQAPFLELGLPQAITAVFLDVEPDAREEFRGVSIDASLQWRDTDTLAACTDEAGGCAAFHGEASCRDAIAATAFAKAEKAERFVQRLDSATRGSVKGCLILD